MNYWIITLEYPPIYGGGIGTYCYETAQMLKQKGWQVTIFLFNKRVNGTKIKSIDGIRIVEFCTTDRLSASLGYDTAICFKFSVIIEYYMEQEGVPTVLESQEYGGIAYYILQKKHLGYPFFKELRIIITIHAPSFLYHAFNHAPSYALPYFWIGEMERWCIKAADHVSAPGNFIIKAIKPFFYSSLREVTVISYPYNWHVAQIDFDTDPRQEWFFFGKLTRQKGIFHLLKACRNLWDKGWRKQMKVIGSGDHFYHPENRSVTSWIKNNYDEEIRKKQLVLLGKQSPSNWRQLTGCGCVVVIPSIGDNYPFTVIESSC
ncbi:MAG: glycosyltransferase family 4 protein [Bacteroidota bacterium]